MKTIFVLDISSSLSLRNSPQSSARPRGPAVIPIGAVGRASVGLACLAFAWALFYGNSIARSATLTWSSTATQASWNVASNWGGAVPGSADIGLFSSASYASQPSLASTAAVAGIWDTGSGAITIGGSECLDVVWNHDQ